MVSFVFPALTMASRNLNQTCRDVISKQYAADHEGGVPYTEGPTSGKDRDDVLTLANSLRTAAVS